MNDLPAPLTPPDCDLRGLAHMPFHVQRYRDSDTCALANGWEARAALALYLASWHQLPAASLPHDDRLLAELSGSGPRWKRDRRIALRGWVECSDGRLYHPFIAELANAAWDAHRVVRNRINRRIEICSFEWERLRRTVFARDDYTCTYCGSRGGILECDHITPVALGGPSVLENLTTACKPCNRSKGSKLLKDWAA